jgi:hypothetical protein
MPYNITVKSRNIVVIGSGKLKNFEGREIFFT